MKKLRKVTNIKVYDFETSPRAYAVSSGKNKFGYTSHNRYYLGSKAIYDCFWNDNVESSSFYWLALSINLDQLKSLKRKVNKIKPGDRVEIIDCPSMIKLKLETGSTIEYEGNHKEEFIEKVLAKKF